MLKNIVLVGFMGTGKTKVSQYLAQVLHRERISTDEWIEKKESKSVPAIFQESGEQYFRQLEKKVVEEIACRDNLIVDCGGGIVLDPQNVSRLKKNGILFYFAASPEVIYQRTKSQSHRPLLNVPDPLSQIRELLAPRKVHYEKADFTIDTDNQTVEQTAEEVLKRLAHE